MIHFDIKLRGLFAAVEKHVAIDDLVAENVRGCLVQAVAEWVVRQGSASLRARFGPSAFLRRGLAHRSKRYEQAQRTNLSDGVQPYASPRGINILRLATALKSGNPLRLVRAAASMSGKAMPMRQAVFIYGSGHTINAVGKRTVRAVLSLPGARALNRGGAKNQIYREQLLDLERSGAIDRKWIWARAETLIAQRVWAPLDKTAPIRLNTGAV